MSWFKSSKTKLQPLPSAPTRKDPEAIAREEVRKRRSRITKTILTGPRGLETEAPGAKKTLLGE